MALLGRQIFCQIYLLQFFKTLTTVISKKISKFLNYTLQNIQKSTHFKKKFKTLYSKVLDKFPKKFNFQTGVRLERNYLSAGGIG